MAERRMFTKQIIDSDTFLDMPASTQMLYFHLCMRADDDGFVDNPKRIMRMVGASEDDMKVLILKSFIIVFESGIIVIKHWRMHNLIRADRKKNTAYQDEMQLLEIKENGAYSINLLPNDNQLTTKCQPSGNQMSAQDSIGKDSIDKNSKKEEASPSDLINNSSLSDTLKAKLTDWLSYKKERRETYKTTGLKSLITTVTNKEKTYGTKAVSDLIDDCMGNGYKGIIWDKLKSQKKGINNCEQRNNDYDAMTRNLVAASMIGAK